MSFANVTLSVLGICLFFGCDSGSKPVSSETTSSAEITSETAAPVPDGQTEPQTTPEVEASQEFPLTLRFQTEYYLTGPQQAAPPDGELPSGSHVRLIEAAGSYSLIESESGIKAYIASDALHPLGNPQQ